METELVMGSSALPNRYLSLAEEHSGTMREVLGVCPLQRLQRRVHSPHNVTSDINHVWWWE